MSVCVLRVQGSWTFLVLERFGENDNTLEFTSWVKRTTPFTFSDFKTQTALVAMFFLFFYLLRKYSPTENLNGVNNFAE